MQPQNPCTARTRAASTAKACSTLTSPSHFIKGRELKKPTNKPDIGFRSKSSNYNLSQLEWKITSHLAVYSNEVTNPKGFPLC